MLLFARLQVKVDSFRDLPFKKLSDPYARTSLQYSGRKDGAIMPNTTKLFYPTTSPRSSLSAAGGRGFSRTLVQDQSVKKSVVERSESQVLAPNLAIGQVRGVRQSALSFLLRLLKTTQAAPNPGNRILVNSKHSSRGRLHPHQLRFCAKVKNGFFSSIRPKILTALKKLRTSQCPFENLPEERASRWGEALTAEKMKECRWVKPKLVCQVAFVEWTDADHLRHCSFVAMRDDKKPAEVVRET
jgi:ATP dependent DNA ligase-like protein